MTDFAHLIGQVARILLGEPNARLSSAHELRYGQHGSLSVDLIKGVWHDHETGEGGGAFDLVARETKCPISESPDWCRNHGCQIDDDRSYHGNGAPRAKTNGANGAHAAHGTQKTKEQRRQDKIFLYVDMAGDVRFEVLRYVPKGFSQRRPDGRGGYIPNLHGVALVPYRLPEITERIAHGHTIFVVEGEKCVDKLWEYGIPASCNPMGAGKWSGDLTPYFEGADIVIIPDFDPQKKHPKTGELMCHQDGRPILPGQDHALAVAMVLSEVANSVRVLDLGKHWPDIKPKDDIFDWFAAGGTVEEFHVLAESAVDWTPELKLRHPDSAPSVQAKLYRLPNPADIPRRQWLSRFLHYMRGVVTSTVAPGGYGKTSVAIYEGLEMVKLGLRVWYISAEDDKDEIDRRIAAYAAHHGLTSEQIGENLFVDDKLTFPFKIARINMKRGIEFDEAKIAGFEATIAANKIDVVFLDPFVSFHYLNESDTGTMDALVKRLGEICARQMCCVELCHHVRKPGLGQSEITVFDARGAAAIVNAVRSCRVINVMSTNELEVFNGSTDDEKKRINPDKRSAYLRIDNGKTNMQPPTKARWIFLASVTIANGDGVQAVEPWNYDIKNPANVLTEDDMIWLRVIFNDRPGYRIDRRSPDWFGYQIAKHYGRGTETKEDIIWINSVIGKWLAKKIIEKDDLPDEQRKIKPHYVCGSQITGASARDETETVDRMLDEPATVTQLFKFNIGDLVQVEIDGTLVFAQPVKIIKVFEYEGETWVNVDGSESAVRMTALRRP